MDAWQTSVEARLGEVKAELNELRNEIAQLRKEMYEGFAKIRAEMRSDMRWMLGVMGAGFTTTVGGFLWLADKITNLH